MHGLLYRQQTNLRLRSLAMRFRNSSQTAVALEFAASAAQPLPACLNRKSRWDNNVTPSHFLMPSIATIDLPSAATRHRFVVAMKIAPRTDGRTIHRSGGILRFVLV
jgi:hypothetical protein